MKLVEMQINDFIAVLGSDTPAPGGGSASALAAAQGIALTKMVTELTIGKKKYAEFEDEIELLQKKLNLCKRVYSGQLMKIQKLLIKCQLFLDSQKQPKKKKKPAEKQCRVL